MEIYFCKTVVALTKMYQKGYEEGAHISKHRCLRFCWAVHSGSKESATLKRQSTNANTELWGENVLQLPIWNAVRQESDENLLSIEPAVVYRACRLQSPPSTELLLSIEPAV